MAPLSVREVDAQLTAPGAPFEIETIEVAGRPTRTWKHAPRSLGDILDHSRDLGDGREFLVLGDERLTHEQHHDRAVRLASALVEEFAGREG